MSNNIINPLGAQNVRANAQYGYNNVSVNPYPYPYATSYKYEEKLRYDQQKAEIDLAKNFAISSQRLEYECAKEKMRLQNKARMEMLSYEISMDSLGRLLYAQIGPDEEEIHSKILLNVLNYTTVHLVSVNPKPYAVLGISWEGCEETVFLKNDHTGILSQIFLRRLKARGVVFRVAKRCESSVADALLSYSLNIAEECEIPFYWGWNMMRNGKWHFTHKNEVTMQEVLKYV